MHQHEDDEKPLTTQDSTTEILDVAPIDFLGSMSKEFIHSTLEGWLPDALAAQALDVQFVWVNETGADARLTAGASLKPTHSFATCPPLDIALMGAQETKYRPTDAELAFVRHTFATCTAFLTICGGVFVPLQAGVLSGRRATGPRSSLPTLRKMAPDVNWTECRWERDGKLWTSGTLLNGLDLMVAFVRAVWGEGQGSLAEALVGIGAWPARARDFPDATAAAANIKA